MNTDIAHYSSSLPHKTAVTLVTHGLNVKPESMMSLVKWLIQHGSDVYLLTLAGHGKNSINIKNVTSLHWIQDMLAGYEMAKRSSVTASVPLYFLGFSLGALLGQSMLALLMENTAFQKQVLFAPAIAVRRRSYLIKLLFFFGRNIQLPSYTPDTHRANESLPLFIYEILFTEEKKILRSKFRKLNIPTLIIIDPKDELISYKRLKRLISRFALNHYRVITLSENADRGGNYHHLIIDEQTMGERNWEIVTNEMEKFLFDPAA